MLLRKLYLSDFKSGGDWTLSRSTAGAEVIPVAWEGQHALGKQQGLGSSGVQTPVPAPGFQGEQVTSFGLSHGNCQEANRLSPGCLSRQWSWGLWGSRALLWLFLSDDGEHVLPLGSPGSRRCSTHLGTFHWSERRGSTCLELRGPVTLRSTVSRQGLSPWEAVRKSLVGRDPKGCKWRGRRPGRRLWVPLPGVASICHLLCIYLARFCCPSRPGSSDAFSVKPFPTFPPAARSSP